MWKVNGFPSPQTSFPNPNGYLRHYVTKNKSENIVIEDEIKTELLGESIRN